MRYLFGIQPTGKIHIGNYLGGLKLAIEKEADIMVADYHALTAGAYDVDSFCIYLEKIVGYPIRLQDRHAPNLAWEIMCMTQVSELQRMIQWKEKKKGNAGLLTYPCLMAADIILSNCDAVIIGEDQTQHAEFYRQVCKRFKIKPCKFIYTKTPKIMSIKDPDKKMSKSLGDAHCLYLGEDNTRKIMKAPTTAKGIRNLKQIASGLGIKFDEKNCLKSKNMLIKKIEGIRNK